MRGIFITFEGCERVGKTTQIKRLRRYLEESGQAKNFVFTREPGGTPTADKIRALILDKDNAALTARAEALLYAASRSQHVEELILPALNEGKNVICDRYYASSVAYQGYGRGLGEEYIRAINGYALSAAIPDITVFLDRSPDSSFIRKGQPDRIESESLEFHKRVYEGFVKQCAMRNAQCPTVESQTAEYSTADEKKIPLYGEVGSVAGRSDFKGCYIRIVPSEPDVTHREILRALRERGIIK